MTIAYAKYAKFKGIEAELLANNHNNIILKLSGVNVTDCFAVEDGQHCVQRIPPTESKGRRQTSYVQVSLLKYVEPFDLTIPDSELEVTTTKGKVKAGGQNQNKTETAVRIVHKPTGLSCFICNERSQSRNKEEALKVIHSKVYQKLQDDMPDNKASKSNRGGKIRTYNYIKSRAVDHRTNKKTSKVEEVIGKGNFDLLK